MSQNTARTILIVIVIGILAFAGYRVLNMKDQRTAGERVSDAVGAISDGVDKAERQLENRTPGEKVGDAVKDVGDDIKDQSRAQ